MVFKVIEIIFVILASFLVYLEVNKMKKIKKTKISYGNGQYIGMMEYQNDYFSITELNKKECLLTVTGGTALRRNIRNGAILANDIIKNLYIKNRYFQHFDNILQSAFLEIEDKNKQYSFENRIAVSILSVQIKEDLLRYANIGTCTLLLYRDEKIINVKNHEDVKEKYGKLKVKPNDKIILLTNGAFLAITEIELMKELESKKETNDKAISIINVIRNKRYKHQENATVVLVEIN